LIRYAILSAWPAGLVFDYGPRFHVAPSLAAACVAVLLILLGGTIALLRRSPALGFLGLWFFVLLAPTSSIVPIVLQPVAERRVSLPLAAIIVAVAAGIVVTLGRRAGWLAVALGAALVTRTLARNRDYHDALSIWSDTVAKMPGNPRAHDHLGNAFAQA